MGTPLQKIQFEIESPEYDNLTVRLTMQWSSEWEHPFNLTPLFHLSQRDMFVFNYLQDVNFPADTSDTFLFDVVLLLLDGFSTGLAAYMMLPLLLASYMLKFKVDNIRSSVKAVRIFGELLVEKATVYAALETSDKAMSLGDFEVDFQELSAHYLASNTTITYTGQVTVSYKSMSKKASFKIVQDFSSTAEVQFVVSETSLEGLLSFLQLPKTLDNIHIPLVGTLDSFASGLDSIGFILKQDIYDSSGSYLKSVFFEVSQDSLVQFLPTAVRPAHIAVKVSIFNPRDMTCRIGVEANFTTDVKNYQLQCKFSILPVPNDNEQRNTGYICTCTLSTSGVNYNTDSSGLDSLMAALGLENTTKAISSSLPVIKQHSFERNYTNLPFWRGQ